MRALIEVVMPEGMSEDTLKEILAKEGIYVETFEKLVEPPCEGWDN